MKLEELMKMDIPDDAPLVVIFDGDELPLLGVSCLLIRNNRLSYAEWILLVDPDDHGEKNTVNILDEKDKNGVDWVKMVGAYIKSAPMTFDTLKYIAENKYDQTMDEIIGIDLIEDYENQEIRFDYADGKILIYDSTSEWYIPAEQEKEFFKNCIEVIEKSKYAEKSVPKSLIKEGFFAPSDEKGWVYPAKLKDEFNSFIKDKYAHPGFYADENCYLIYEDGDFCSEVLWIEEVLRNEYLQRFKDFVLNKCYWKIVDSINICFERKYGDEKPEKIQIPISPIDIDL